MEARREAPPIRVALKANKPVAMVMLMAWLGLFFLCTWALANLFLLNATAASKGVVGSLLGLITCFCFFALVRSFGLVWVEGGALIFDEQGVRDRISLVSLGFVPLRYVKSVSFTDIFIWRFIEIDIHPKAFYSSFAPKRFFMGLYQFVFGSSLRLPLFLFEASSADLESRLLHFQRVRQQQAERMQQSERETERSNSMGRSKGGSLPFSETLIAHSSEFDNSHIETPPLPDGESETQPLNDDFTSNQILARVASIREFVKKLGLDHAMAEFYWDFVRNFPHWARAQDIRMPKGVERPEEISATSELEHYVFHLSGHRYQLILEKNIGSGRQALLSVVFDGEKVMSLRVQLEIGTLEPVEVDSFIDGQWRQELSLLFRKIRSDQEQEMAKRLSTEDEELESDALTPGSRSEIVRLKKKFGLKD